MEMPIDDDDDFWANEDFIATIEIVVKKAEEASAARHGGTQTQSAATPHASAVVPPQTNDCRVGESGPSAHDTPYVLEFLGCRSSDGSIAPGAASAATISGGREVRVAHFRGIPSIGTPQPLGQQEVSFQSRSQQGQASIQGPHQSVQEVSVNVQPPRGDAGQQMAEKDGIISFLRCRMEEVEKQLDELRQRVGLENVSHLSLHQQQLELERLSAQLLFKDHEIVEGRRACDEMGERLKDALAETAALKDEFDKLKSFRHAGVELKQPRNDEGMDVLEHTWSPPWMPERISEAEGITTTGLYNNSFEDAREEGDYLILQEEFPANMRTGGGGVVIDGRDSRKFDKVEAWQANDTHKRDMSGGAGTSTSGRSDREELLSSHQLNSYSRTREMYYSLQHLWGLKGVRNDGIFLLSKLYASCMQDLFILFSDRESQSTNCLKGTERGNEGRTKGYTISEKLHIALAEVTNGLAQPEIIFSPLLELCKLDNASLVGSALHVLRCILQHDFTCRGNLLPRCIQQGVDYEVQSFFCSKTLKEKTSEDRGWCIIGAPNEGNIRPMGFRVMFSSPRILFPPQEEEDFALRVPDRRGLTENGADKCEQRPPRASHQLQQPTWEHEEAGCDDNYVPAEDLNLLVKWMLQLALTSSSLSVKFEAIANIGVLVMNSEPLTERLMFGTLLCHGAMDLLLKESSRTEIQLQADDSDEIKMNHSKFINDGDARRSSLSENRTGKPLVDSRGQGSSGGQTLGKSKMADCSAPKQLSYTELSKVRLLEGLTECLKFSRKTSQEIVLHRSVIKLLSFILAFGESGTAVLMQAGSSCEDFELGKTYKDDSKLEGVLGGEGASGQHIVDGGSGSIHLKGQDLVDKGNGIPIILVDDCIDDSERAQNIPQRLLTLINSELEIEEREEWTEPRISEHRYRLVYEAVTLLCRLSSDAVQSPAVIGHLISNKNMARLALSVTNRLVSRKSHSKQSWAGQKPADVAELARVLRGRVLRSLEETSPFFFYQ